MFIVIVEGKEVFYDDGRVAVKHGDKFLVLDEPDGWVEATSGLWNSWQTEGEAKSITTEAKCFPSYKSAEKFAKKWKGHPWWCEPNGNYEILEVFPVTKEVIVGYSLTPKSVETVIENKPVPELYALFAEASDLPEEGYLEQLTHWLNLESVKKSKETWFQKNKQTFILKRCI